MRPLIDIQITRAGVPIFTFSNVNNPIGYEIQVSRSVAYKAQKSQVKIYNFVMPNLDGIAIKRAEELDIISIYIGYRIDGVDRWTALCNGRVAVWRQEGSDLIITFIEGAVNSMLVLDFLLSAFPLEEPITAIWPVILQKCYPKINGLEHVPNTIATVGTVSLWDILQQFVDSTQLLYFFANEYLNIVPIFSTAAAIDVQNVQRSAALLKETNPYLILENVNPMKKATRLWSFEILYRSDLNPGDKVTFLDFAGLIHTGTIGTITTTACSVTNKSLLSVFEEAEGV